MSENLIEMRQKFEAWVLPQMSSGITALTLDEKGEYAVGVFEFAWRAYQEGAALAQAEAQPEAVFTMEQFGGLVGLARDHARERAVVYKATNFRGDTCHFGVKSLARIWAKGGGKVEEIPIRDLRVVSERKPAAPAVLIEVERDAARFGWLCDDHADHETRERVRSICESIPVSGIGSTRASIDANMLAAAPEVKS